MCTSSTIEDNKQSARTCMHHCFESCLEESIFIVPAVFWLGLRSLISMLMLSRTYFSSVSTGQKNKNSTLLAHLLSTFRSC